MMNQLTHLIGKSIQSDEIKKIFEENGIKYPKKDTLSNRSNDRDFWIVSKKTGLDFLFSIEIRNTSYPSLPGKRKGIFIPRLNYILFKEKAKIDYPPGINFNSTLNELKDKLGEPSFTGKSKIEDYHLWNIFPTDREDIVFCIYYSINDDEIGQISLKIKEEYELIELYDPLLGRTSEIISEFQNGFYTKKRLFFINWSLQNGFLSINNSSKDLLKEFKSGKTNIIEFATRYFTGKSYIALEDFTNVDTHFIRDYYNNLSGYDIIYQRDFALTFLKDEALRNNYLGKEAFTELAKIKYSPENLNLISNTIEQRYQEYQKHQFSKSNKII